jgi:HlyD family secretion protein
VTEGQSVKAGKLLVSLNSSDAQKSVRDAQANLDAAKISLQKLQEPTDQLTLLQAENAITSANEAKQSAQDDLSTAYDNAYNNISNTFLDLPDIMTNLNTILFGTTLGESNQWNIDYLAQAVESFNAKVYEYQAVTKTSFKTAQTEYTTNFDDYKATSRLSDIATIEKLLDETYQTTKDVAEAIKNTNNYIQFYEYELNDNNLKPLALADTYLSDLNTYTSQVNSHVTALSGSINTISADKNTITNSDRTIAEKSQSLAELKAGTDPLDIQSQELSIKQKENALLDAKQTLADYYVYAPFDGVIANVAVKKGDSVSSGTTVATIITTQKIAEVSLNEVDVANVKVGQKATLTFDAVENLSITGEVAQVDTIGTVSSGVVTYDVKINFDTQDDRVKSGMSVSASIITETSQDVLEVPSSAIKTSNNVSYVLQLGSQYTDTSSTGVVSAEAPTQTQVETGLSDDTYTEITSGLKEGDLIVVKTIKSSTTSSGSKANTNTNKSSGSSSILGGGMPPR